MKKLFAKKQIETLVDLGLNEAQAVLYLTSLKYGILSVMELFRLTKISRQKIYEEAEKMIDLGVYETTGGQRKKYIAINPIKLAKLGERKINETKKILTSLSDILPQLETLSIPRKNEVVVKYFERIPKIREAYEEELAVSKNTEVLSFAGSIDNTFDFFPEHYWDKWNKKFVKHNSRSRMLVHNSEVARKTSKYDKKYKRETRWLQKFPLKVNIDVFNQVVLVVSFHDEIAIWVESQMLAQSYRIMFETLWSQAKPFNK